MNKYNKYSIIAPDIHQSTNIIIWLFNIAMANPFNR